MIETTAARRKTFCYTTHSKITKNANNIMSFLEELKYFNGTVKKVYKRESHLLLLQSL